MGGGSSETTPAANNAVNANTATGSTTPSGNADANSNVTDANASTDADNGDNTNADTTEQSADQADDAESKDPEAVDAWDWTGRTKNLTLSSPDGLSLDTDALKQQVEELAAKAAEDQAASESDDAAAEADENNATDEAAAADEANEAANTALTQEEQYAYLRAQLPETLPGKLSLGFMLDPAAQGSDTGNHSVVLANDTFTVKLPEGIKLSNTDKFDVYQYDKDGNRTNIRIAQATVKDGGATIEVKFTDPVDTKIGTKYYVGTPAENTVPATQAEGKQQLDVLRTTLNLEVQIPTTLVSNADEASIAWTLQTSTDGGSDQKATLTLPSLTTLADQLSLTLPEPEENNDEAPAEEATEGDNSANAVSNGDDFAVAPLSIEDGKTEYSVEGNISADPITLTWADNNSSSRPTPDNLRAGFKLKFYLGGMGPYEATKENFETFLHVSDFIKEDDWDNLVTVSPTGVNKYTVTSLASLPDELNTTTFKQKTEDGKLVYDDEGKPVYVVAENLDPVSITWVIEDTNDYAEYNYLVSKTDDGTLLRLMETQTFNVVGKVGNEGLDQLDDAENADLYLRPYVDNKPYGWGEKTDYPNGYPIDSVMQGGTNITTVGGTLEWEAAEGTQNHGAITGKLPAYTPEGLPIDWSLKYVRTGDNTDDYYAATYNNTASDNHGSDVTAVYNGGTVTLTRVGTTTFTAYKAWLDNGAWMSNPNSPSVTFTLWRYSGNSDATKASQVTDKNGAFVTLTLTQENAGQYLEKTEDGAQVIDLGKLLKDQAPNLTLDKYDSDGYPFIYGLREDTSLSGYEIVFGEVETNENGVETVNSYGPNYLGKGSEHLNAAGVEVSFDGTYAQNRPETDRLTYNGDTVSNRLSDEISVSINKSWTVAAFADQLSGVTSEFTLYQSVDGETWSPAHDDEGKPISKTLTDFTAEQLTKQLAGRYPKYDEEGKLLQYHWLETDVTQDGTSADGENGINFQLCDADGNPIEDADSLTNIEGVTATFTLYLNTLENSGSQEASNKEKVNFTASYDAETNTINNAFENVVDEHVVKQWFVQESEDTDPVEITDPEQTGPVTVWLFQGETKIGDYVLNGYADDGASPVVANESDPNYERFAGATYQETDQYHLTFSNLPLYDENGARYIYRIVEDEPNGWHSTREYDAETHTTRIVNEQGPGEGTDFYLQKDWIDGGDSAHRLKVLVDVYAKEDIENSKGEVVWHKGELIDSNIELSEANGWFDEFTVSKANGVTYDQLDVQETYLVSTDAAGIRYEVVTYQEAKEKFPDADWVNQGWGSTQAGSDYNNAHKERVATDDHVYEVTYTNQTAEQSGYDQQTITVHNRRLGLIEVTVEKEWVDGNADPSERPDATYTLSVDDPGAQFHEDNDGSVEIKLSDGEATTGNWLPIYTDKNQSQKLTGTVSSDNKSVTVNVPKGGANESLTVVFYGLPKYTGAGDVVHYTVTEQLTGSHDFYTNSMSEDDYTVGKLHFHDVQGFKATNRRSGTTSATFYKKWKDEYVNDEIDQRPDIYLTLYRVASGKQGAKPEQVPGYVQYLWKAREEDPSTNASEYEQKCTIDGLARFDSDGYEYAYYATEQMSSDGESLGYGDVTFSDEYNRVEDEDDLVINVETGVPANPEDDNVKGTGYALKSGGTFTNALTGNITVNGIKLWQNTPGQVSQSDLPEVLVLIQQKLAGDNEWPELRVEKQSGNVIDSIVAALTGGSADAWVPVVNEDGTSGAIAWTTNLERAGNNQWKFTITHTGNNTKGSTGEELPRYDENGNRYEYRAVEVIVGLVDKPGGISSEVLENMDLSKVSWTAGDVGSTSTTGGNTYVIQHGESGSFRLYNTYQPQKGSLTVKKVLSGDELAETDTYPDVTFTLHRKYASSDPRNIDNDQVVDTYTMKSAELKAGNGVATHTFENLDIYAPNGEYWQYYVVETSIDGYTTKVGLGDLSEGSDELEEAELGDDGYASDVAMKDGKSLVEPAKTEQGGQVTYDTTPDITFENTYEPQTLTLTGTKQWDDLGNAFNTRPDSLDLSLVRYTVNQVEESVALSTNDGDKSEEGYLTWTKNQGNNTWTYTISNLEQWAPDGNAWTYKVTEKLEDGQTAYRIITGSSTAAGSDENDDDAYEGTFGNLVNRLAGSATVNKKWVLTDGVTSDTDEWGLRPESVTVELQARVKGQADSTWGEWGKATEILQSVAGVTGDIKDTVKLKEDNNWSHSWASLPYTVKGKNNSDNTYLVQYRVIETKLGDANVSEPDSTSVKEEGNKIQIDYGVTASYDGSGETTINTSSNTSTGSSTSTSGTVLTNTLESTELTVEKKWEDESNKWGLRDTFKDQFWEDNWTVTFVLQRKEGQNGTWENVTVDSENVTATITGSLLAGSVTLNGATATFANLPKFAADGTTEYIYRAVEQVPGGYELKNALTNQNLESGYEAVAGDSSTSSDADVADQTFTNTLFTIKVLGDKKWNDYGVAELVPGDSDNDTIPDSVPELKIEQSVSGSDEWVDVTDLAGQPTWTYGENEWAWEYSKLPQYDENGNPYVYRVSENAGSLPGFYPTYENGDQPAGTSPGAPTGESQTASDITNVATRFTLDKVSDFGNHDLVNDVELAVIKDGEVYAVWQRNASGVVSSYVWQTPASTAAVWQNGMTEGRADTAAAINMGSTTYNGKSNAGWIIGLPEGTYQIQETGYLPENYARAESVPLTISADGTISLGSGVSNAKLTGDRDGENITITVTDELFRGYFTFTKALGTAGGNRLEGVVFDLYRVGAAGSGELIAQGLTTDKDGVFDSSKATDIKFENNIDFGVGGTEREDLADGLPAGEYYLLEKETTDDAYYPSGDELKFSFTIDQEANHGTANKVTVKDNAAGNSGDVLLNTPFRAAVSLRKYDADAKTSEPINNAEFELQYKVGDEWVTSAQGLKTGKAYNLVLSSDTHEAPVPADPAEATSGVLQLTLNMKGEYRLIETANQGYEVPESDADKYTVYFKLENVDQQEPSEGAYDLTNSDVQAPGAAKGRLDVSATLNSQEVQLTNTGIPNKRLTGSLSLTKADTVSNAPIDGATFELRKETSPGKWTTIVSDLESGKSYKLNDANDAVDGEAINAPSYGQLVVSNLLWGTYCFVETDPKDGYIGETDTGKVMSAVLTINRDTFNASNSGTESATLGNSPTQLKIKKVDGSGNVITADDATFIIHGVFAGKTEEEDREFSTTDGVLTVPNATLVAGNTYTLSEKTAPAGYELAGSIQFKVNQNGVVSLEGSTTGNAGSYTVDTDGDGINLITVSDEQISITLQKSGDKESPVENGPYAGAEFTISGDFAGNPDLDEDDNLVKTTNDQGTLDLTGVLIAGETYTLYETKAPKGYELIKGSLAFKVESDGTVKPVGPVPEGYGVADGSVIINATDPSIEVTLVKYGANNEKLPNATFTVKPKGDSAFANGDKDAITCTTQKNGAVQLDSAILVADNTYILEEVTAPDGYEIAGTVEFTVNDNGTVELGTPTGGTGSYVATEINGTVIISATDKQTDITLIKVSTKDDKLLPGAEFTLEPASQGGGFANTDLNGDGKSDLVGGKLHLTSGANDEIALVGVLNGGQSYRLTEIKAPDGYELADNPSFTFDVAKDGTIAAVKGQDEAAEGKEGFRVTSDGKEIELTIADEPIEAKIVKQDKNGNELQGAEFMLSGKFADDATQITVRDGDDGNEDGIISLPSAKLIAGNEYVIEEIVAPDGYEIAGKATLLVNSDGSITVKSQTKGSGEYVPDDENGVAVITAKDKQIALGLEKVGTDGVDGLTATFTIKPMTGSSFKTAGMTSIDVTPGNAEEKTRGELLEGDTYTITEKAPANGYQLTEGEFAFTVGADGAIEVASGGTEDAEGVAGYRVDANKIKIIATDAPVAARVVKENKNGETQPGAVFSIKPVKGSAFAKNNGLEKDGSLKLTTTGDDGVADIPSAMLIAGNSYTITEVTAPKGYELAGSVTFQVSDDGKDITLTGDVTDASGSYQASAPGGLLTLTATDEPVEITLSKENADGDSLSGAEFSVTPAEGSAFADGSDNAIPTTNGAELSGKLVAGQRYVLTETEAPAGYELIDGRLTFSVSEDGTIAKVTDGDVVNDEAFGIVDGGIVIRAVDKPIEITLNKVSSEDASAKLKATFELTGRFASDEMDGTADGDKTNETYTAENGVVTLTRLIAGETYELREVASESGYEVISGSLTFTVDKSGAIDYAVGTSHDPAFTIENGKVGKVAITAENTPVKITVEKQDLSGNKLSGAEFKLEGDFADGSDKKTVKSGEEISGLIVTNGSDRHEYTLTETKAPDGYELIDGGLTFTVDTNGTVAIEGGSDAYVEGNEVTLVAKDTPIEVKLRKIGEGINDPLEGAVFEIFEGDETDPLVTLDPTDKDGYAEIDPALLVQGKVYTIREKTAPDGYELAGSARFQVNEDGTLTFLKGGWLFFAPDEQAVVAGEGGSGEYGTDVVENGVALIVVSDSGIMAELNKVGENGAPLAGATFRLVDSADPEATEQILTVNEQGSMALSGLVAGHTYILTEIEAPAGYELNDMPFTFTVDANGELHKAEGQEDSGYTIGPEDGVTITASDTPIEITLEKRDLGTTSLEGAVFELTGTFADGAGKIGSSEPQELTVEDGSITIKGLIASRPDVEYTYTLTEKTAPEGYEVVAPFHFKVDEGGNVVPVDEERADNTKPGYDAKGDTLTAHDEAIQINLRKVDEATGKALDGAKFELAPAKGSHFAGGSEKAISVTPGDASALNGKLIANNTYTLTETEAPTGYEKIAGPFTFTVNADGTIKPASAGNDPAYALDKDGITITATDAQIEVGLVKRGVDGAQVAGAHFSLASADDPDTQLGEDIVSTADGVVNILNLEIGKTYVLTETQAPAGYERIDGSFTFKVEDNGTISIPDGVENAAAYTPNDPEADQGVVTITVTDGPVELQIEKRGQDKDGKLLSGATFQIAPAKGTDTTFANGTTEPLSFSTTNGTTEVISQQLVEGGTYVLTETAAPAGYERITGSLTFTVEHGGSIKAAKGDGITNDEAFSINEEDGLVTITAVDEPIQIELTKTDPTGTALDGAEFSLTGTFANADGTPAAEPDTQTVAAKDGTVTLENLIATVAGGTTYTYELTETKAPAGYELIPGTLTFTVDEAGNLQNVTAPAGYTAEGGTAAIVAQDTPVAITVSKVDAADQPLDGAVFELTGDFRQEDGSVKEDTRTLKNAFAGEEVTGLVASTEGARHEYTLTETQAPEGYESLGSFTFTINPDGTVTGTGAGYSLAAGNVGIVAQDTAIEARLVKTGLNAEGKLVNLSGAVFTITPADGSTFANEDALKLDENGALTLEATAADGTAAIPAGVLIAGNTYTVAEVTAPSGYELAGSATFRVNSDGTLTLIADDGSDAATVAGANGTGSYEVTVDGGTAVITASDSGIAAQLVKVDGKTPLAGAQFSLAPAEGSAFASGSTEPKTLTVNANGLTALPELMAGATYTLTETLAPAGYELNRTVFTFTVAADGSLAPVENTDQAGYTVSGKGIVTVTVDDEPIELALEKTDLAGNALDGAEFRLTGTFAGADGTTAAERTVAVEDGAATLTDLIASTDAATYIYTLTETKAPAGHELAGSFGFTVTPDGTLLPAEGAQQAADGQAGYRISADGLTLAAADAPVEAQLVKTDAAGNPLAGAVFEITPADGSAFAGSYADKDALTLEATAADGVASVPAGALIAGNSYTVTEVTAPAGYELAGTATFTVNADGTLTFADADANGAADVADGSGTYAVSANGGTAVITATDAAAELVVSKLGANGPLAGATLTLIEVADANGAKPAEAQRFEVVTDEAGTARFAGLKAGSTYELAETAAPAGYELLDQTARITVQADGTVEPASGTELPAAFAIGEDGAQITMLNQQVGVSLVKRDAEGHGLAGAEFTLAGAFADGSTERTFTSDEDGVVFAELVLAGSAEGTPYVLTETKAPAGFELLAPVTLLVFEDGTVSVDEDATEAPLSAVTVDNAGSTAMVALADTAIEVTFQKADAAGKALGGATFRVTGTFADGSESCEVVSDADGSLAVPQVVAGETYTIEETAAPEGYQLIDGTFEFTVTEDGVIEAESTSKQNALTGSWSAGYVVSESGLALTAVDELAPTTEEPGEPVEPSEPGEPGEPGETDEPPLPETGEQPKPESTGEQLLPTTGDAAQLIGYVAAAGALMLLAGLAHRARRRMTRR